MVADTFSPSITGVGRGLDVHLELGLLVLLDPERAAATVGNEDLINSQRRVRGQLERAVEASEGVGREVLGEDLVPLGILDLDGEGLAGELRGIRLIVAGARDPELEPHRRAGTIDRPVGDRVDLDLVVGRIVLAEGPDVREAQVSESALRRPRGDEPLVRSLRVVQLGDRDLELAVVVGLERERLGLDAELVLAVHLHHAPAEQLDVGPRNGLAGPRIGDEVVGLVRERLLDDDRVVEPDHDPAGVAPLHPRGQQVGAGLLERRGDGDPLVEVAGQRLQVQVPAGRRNGPGTVADSWRPGGSRCR